MIGVGFDGVIFGLQRVGGISTYAWEMLRRLSACPTFSVTLGLPSSIQSDRASELMNLPLRCHRDLLPVQVARYLSTSLSGDIVHSTYYRLPASRRAKRVVTAYDFVYEKYRSGIARYVHGVQKSRACTNADLVLCISGNTRSDLIAEYPQLDPAKVVVTPLAVDHTIFFVPKTVRTELAEHVVFVGQRTGYKRFDLAVKAVALAGLHLTIVGAHVTAAERAQLDNSLRGRWVATGRVDDAELQAIYASAHSFIYPSDYEGFGLPILEAQACGCPTVVANRSSFPEVGGKAALFADTQTPEAYAECLVSLDDASRRSAAVAAGLANASKFNWDNTFALTTDAYASIL